MSTESILFNEKISSGKSILAVEKLIDWKRQNGKYNFQSLPDTAIITAFSSKYSRFSGFKKLKGLNGKNFISKNKSAIVSTGVSSGGTGLINLCEEIRCLGVKRFFFIGVAASIIKGVAEGELYFVNKVFSASGVSFFYENNELIQPKSLSLSSTQITNLNCKKAMVISTDAPFRETEFLLQNAKLKGAELIEMECAGLYAFCNFHNLSGACFVVAADKLDKCWHPPQDLNSINQKGNKMLGLLLNMLKG